MKYVIACIDGVARTPGICDYAIWAANRLDTDLDFLHVTERPPEYAPVAELTGNVWLGAQASLLQELTELDQQRSALAQEQGRQFLQIALERARSQGAAARVDARQRHGDLLETLLELEPDTRLFVLGQHERPVKASRLLPDHRLESAVRALHRPILVASAHFREPASFMVAYDGSPTADRTVDIVSRSPLLTGLSAHVVTVGGKPGPAGEALERARAQLAGAGFEAQAAHVPEGEPAAALTEYAARHGVDMLAMGAYGHSRIRRLVVGSTTTEILGKVRLPLLILR